MEKKLSEIYYSTEGYWKGYAAIDKLAERAEVSKDEVKTWLEKQALWQIYLRPPKYIPRPHWTVDRPNYVHQADLLFVTYETIGKRTFKYILVVVDVASRYVDAEPFSKKDSISVEKAFEKIYSRKLTFPRIPIVDPGTEFKGEVTKLMKDHDVHIQQSEAKTHRAQALVERANRILAERLYSHQYAQILLKGNETWKRRLTGVIQAINSEPRRILTNETQIDAVDDAKVKIEDVSCNRPVGLDEERLPPGVKVKYLYAPGEDEGGDRRRATDPIWSAEVYNLDRIVVSYDQPVLYYLPKPTPRRGFVREELQVVPEGTELPPNHVL